MSLYKAIKRGLAEFCVRTKLTMGNGRPRKWGLSTSKKGTLLRRLLGKDFWYWTILREEL